MKIMKEIPLGHGKFAIVDSGDYVRLSKFKWHIGHGYAVRSQAFGSRTDGTRFVRIFSMAREIIGAVANGKIIDHKSGDKLDNRRRNLRVATHQQNIMNMRLLKRNQVGLKGVQFRFGKFRARIRFNRKLITLGTFESAKLAHEAYTKAARLYFGEFARAA